MTWLDNLQQLPPLARQTIPLAYRDINGHMNVQFYMELYDVAGWNLFDHWGVGKPYVALGQFGMFALEQHIRYMAEVQIGQSVALYGRLLGYDARFVHFILYIVNETAGKLASTLEEVAAHVDLQQRRTAVFSEAVIDRLTAELAAHTALTWPARSRGCLRV